VVLGAVAGLRSILPLALLAWLAPPVPWLSAFWARWLFGLAAAGELVSDKLPRTPSRLNPGPLIGRLVLGGLVGSLSVVPTQTPVWMGALIGALASAAGSFGGAKLRAVLVRKTGKPDLWIALLEDALAIGAATWALLGPLGPR
jgi:uncharacterized membrane protein